MALDHQLEQCLLPTWHMRTSFKMADEILRNFAAINISIHRCDFIMPRYACWSRVYWGYLGHERWRHMLTMGQSGTVRYHAIEKHSVPHNLRMTRFGDILRVDLRYPLLILPSCFAGIWAIIRMYRWQWSNPEGYWRNWPTPSYGKLRINY